MCLNITKWYVGGIILLMLLPVEILCDMLYRQFYMWSMRSGFRYFESYVGEINLLMFFVRWAFRQCTNFYRQRRFYMWDKIYLELICWCLLIHDVYWFKGRYRKMYFTGAMLYLFQFRDLTKCAWIIWDKTNHRYISCWNSLWLNNYQ